MVTARSRALSGFDRPRRNQSKSGEALRNIDYLSLQFHDHRIVVYVQIEVVTQDVHPVELVVMVTAVPGRLEGEV